MSSSILPRVSRTSLARMIAGPTLLCLALAAGCSSGGTGQVAAPPTTEAKAPVTTAPATTASKVPGNAEASSGTETDAGSDATGSETTETTEAPSDSSDSSGDDIKLLPPGATAGLDDLGGDGEPDPTCGTQDFGQGLVLRIPCEIVPTTENEPPVGSVLVKDSLYRLPGGSTSDFENVSATVVTARNEAGQKVAVIFFNSDAMFATGSAKFDTDATGISLDATLKLINKYPGGAVQVRGHTDSTGTDAANQTLSEARAKAVKSYFDSHGVAATSVTAVGFGRTQPVVEDKNPDGSDNTVAMNFNRRVEIAVTLPAGA